MLKACPNLSNPDVAREFNEIVEATNETAAYHIWSQNNGFAIDKAPNGEPSIAFQQLLQITNGDRVKAIKAKARLYTKSFEREYGDWTNDPESYKGELDQNGEPIISYKNTKRADTDVSYLDEVNVESIVSKNDSLEKLKNGEIVSSSDIISTVLDKKYMSYHNRLLASILKAHDIPVKIGQTNDGTIMECIIGQNGERIIVINENCMNNISNRLFSDTILHEVIHAVTADALDNPKTKEDIQFKKDTQKLFDTFSKLFPEDLYPRTTQSSNYYMLTDIHEFAAVFATDIEARMTLMSKAIQAQKKSSNKYIEHIKSFINSLTNLLVNRKIFSTIEEQIEYYQNKLNNYLIGSIERPIVKGNLKQIADDIYNNLNYKTIINDAIARYKQEFSQAGDRYFSSHAMIKIGKQRSASVAEIELDQVCKKAAEHLSKRLQAIMASQLPQEYKSQQQQVLKSQIQQFESQTMSKFQIISTFLSQTFPQINDDYKKLKNLNEFNKTISDSQYMYYCHDNFGVYKVILEELDVATNNEVVITLLTQQAKNDNLTLDESVVTDVDRMRKYIEQCSQIVQSGQKLMGNILINNVQESLRKEGEETKSPSMVDYLEQLRSIGYDTNAFFTTIGSLDRAKDDGLRALSRIVNKAIWDADKVLHDKSVQLLQLQKNLKLGEKVTDLYEIDENGLTTGYLVRSLNYGKFYNDYNNFLHHLNESMGLSLDNRVAPNDERMEEWNTRRNEWLSQHAERRFKPEYYAAYSKLSQQTQAARELIQSQIRVIKEKAKEEIKNAEGKIVNTIYHFDQLDDADWKRLNNLYMQKKQLSSDYDINGNLKEEGTPDYQIAKELQELHKTLYEGRDVKKAVDRWKQDREAVIKSCGGRAAMLKGRPGRGETSEFDWEKLDKWDSRNTKKGLKRDEDGNTLLMNWVNSKLESLPYYGEEYEENEMKIRELMRPYRSNTTGDIDASLLPKSVQKKIKFLEKENRKIKRRAIAKDKNLNKDKNLEKLAKQRADLIKAVADFVPTDSYKKLKAEAARLDDGENGILDAFELATGYYIDFDETIYRLHRWFTKMVAKPEVEDQFMDMEPGDGYIEVDETDELRNTNFDESEHRSIVPKRELYDNSKQYNKIMKSATLKALYDGVLNTIKESNQLYEGRNYVDDYQLPQITGTMYKKIKNKPSAWRQVFNDLKDIFSPVKMVKNIFNHLTDKSTKFGTMLSETSQSIGISKESSDETGQYGQDVNYATLSYDELGSAIQQLGESYVSESVSGRRPDGRQLNIVPQSFTKKLEDPSLISSDLVGITCEYYHAANMFKNRNSVKDKCEAIVDMMENREYTTRKFWTKDSSKWKKHTVRGSESNTYKAARQFLDVNMYDIRTQKMEKTLFGKYTIDFSKIAKLFRDMTTAINLGLNQAVALTGFTTSTTAHIVNAITGRRYDITCAAIGAKKFISYLFKNIGGAKQIGNQLSNDDLMVQMEYFNISDQGNKKYKHTNWNQLGRAANNWCFGMLSGLDFAIKNQIMTSTLASYRFYDGEFITEEQLRQRFYQQYGRNKVRRTLSYTFGIGRPLNDLEKALNKFQKCKRLDMVLVSKNNKFTILDGYEKAFKKIEEQVRYRILNYAENADGMATATQKAAITTAALGAAVLQHRQFFPLMLQERFGETVYDMSQQQYEGGIFRSATDLAINVFFGGIKDLIQHRNLTIRERYNRHFNNRSSEKDYERSRARKLMLKQIAVEISYYNLITSPFVAAICAYADGDDDDDSLMNRVVAYVMQNILMLNPDDSITQQLAYIGRRTQWETFTPYRFDDALNTMKSVAAQTGTSDKLQALGEGVFNGIKSRIFPRADLFDTFFGVDGTTSQSEEDYFTTPLDSRSTYAGYTKFERDLWKATPMHNFTEQFAVPKKKRKYYEHQVMRLNKN